MAGCPDYRVEQARGSHGLLKGFLEARVSRLAAKQGPQASARVRIVAGASRAEAVAAVYEATAGKPDVAVYGGEVVSAGRVEMLPYLHEQAVSITAHRFGTPNKLSEGLI